MNICHSISFLLFIIIFLLVSECGKGGSYPPNTHPNLRSGSPPSLLFGRRRKSSLRKQPTFGDATTVFPAKRRLRNERKNSILMMRYYPDLGSVSDWLK